MKGVREREVGEGSKLYTVKGCSTLEKGGRKAGNVIQSGLLLLPGAKKKFAI